jgi:Polyketide cyclase / dehydrase and lipid transport
VVRVGSEPLGRAGHNGSVDLTADLDAPCPPEVLFDHIDDLGDYPSWLEIVERATPDAASVGDDGRPAWLVDLRGRLGPLARSKRLRMVRTERQSPRVVRFERQERDGREHSPWVLEGRVESTAGGSRLVMRLHYGGTFGGAVLEHLLGEAIERSRPALLAQVS